MQIDNSPNTYPQHPLLKSIGFHIIPGAFVTIGFIVFKFLLDSRGYPSLLAFLLAILLIDLPVMWGVMLYSGWKKTGRIGLDSIVLYQEKLPWRKFLMIIIGAFVVAFALVTLSNPITAILAESVFSGLPNWMFLDEQSQYQAYAKNVLVTIFLFQFVLTGVILPWTEELYFRGFLLPRLTRFGKWAPLVGGLFFGLYHSWQLYGFVSIFLLGTILGYIVWWQRDIRLSISLHIIANVFTRLTMLLTVITM